MSGPKILIRIENPIGATATYTLEAGTDERPKHFFLRVVDLNKKESVEVTQTLRLRKDKYLACLHVGKAAVFIEPQMPDLEILATGWKPGHNTSTNWDRVRLPQSTENQTILCRLRQLDMVTMHDHRVTVEYCEPGKDEFDYTPSGPITHLCGESQEAMGSYGDIQTEGVTDVREELVGLLAEQPDEGEVPETPATDHEIYSAAEEDPLPVLSALSGILTDEENKENVAPDGEIPADPRVRVIPASDSDKTEGPLSASGRLFSAQRERDLPRETLEDSSTRQDSQKVDSIIEGGAESDLSFLDDVARIFGLHPPASDPGSSPTLTSSLVLREIEDMEVAQGQPSDFSTENIHSDQMTMMTRDPKGGSSSDDIGSERGLRASQEKKRRSNEIPEVEEAARSVKKVKRESPPYEHGINYSEEEPIEEKKLRKSLSTPRSSRRLEIWKNNLVSSENESSDDVSSNRGSDSGNTSLGKAATLTRRNNSFHSSGSSASKASKIAKSYTTSDRDTSQDQTPSKTSTKSEPDQSGYGKYVDSDAYQVKAYRGKDPRVLFSSTTMIDRQPIMTKFLSAQGGSQVTVTDSYDVLCIGKGDIKKTAKLITAGLTGKDIVVDSWLSDSAEAGYLLNVSPYFPSDRKHEMEWNVDLADVIRRARDGYKPLVGHSVYFSPSLKRSLGSNIDDLKDIASAAGATICSSLPKNVDEDTLLIVDLDDKDVEKYSDKGWRMYTRKLLTLGVLRTELDLDGEEFVVTAQG